MWLGSGSWNLAYLEFPGLNFTPFFTLTLIKSFHWADAKVLPSS